MSNTSENKELQLSDFEYELPEELIAQHPPEVRHGSRLMWLDRATKRIENRQFTDIAQLLMPGDLLIVNDTKVIPARLSAFRQTGGKVDILLLRPESTRPWIWQAMATPLRKLKDGELLNLADKNESVKVHAIFEAEDGQKRILLDFGSQENVYRILSETGLAPLPPYIRRQLGDGVADQRRGEDLQRYQTIFAKAPGAVAAPTAGLHFSEDIFAQLRERGVETRYITLHVGPGTFKPITTSVDEHTIESELFSISSDTANDINRALDEGRRIVAVGTTSCRALETAGASGRVRAVDSEQTSIYIKPGFEFRVVKALITNFHLSQSSLLVLVAAFAGRDFVMKAYEQAVVERYRFYSYGDAMLIT
jgi:S-adenosylmethionine:tRNA ribosyltransferase-isomerase